MILRYNSRCKWQQKYLSRRILNTAECSMYEVDA